MQNKKINKIIIKKYVFRNFYYLNANLRAREALSLNKWAVISI